MFDTYDDNTDPDLDISLEVVQVGLCCAASIDKKWPRVKVAKRNRITDNLLKFLDFGGLYSVQLKLVYHLFYQHILRLKYPPPEKTF